MTGMTTAGKSDAAAAGADPDPGPESACGGVLRNDLGWALGVVFRSYVKAANAAFADVPGGPRGYQVLAAATRGEPGSQLELAHHLGVDRTVMTYLLDDLERAGLIERRPDPADRRARRIAATERGRELLGDLDRRLRAAEDQVLTGLESGQDRRAFRGMLRRLATHANALDAVPDACAVAQQVRSGALDTAALDGVTPRKAAPGKTDAGQAGPGQAALGKAGPSRA
jgi:DNA-binding MarR family transcriptional regulator